MTTQQLEIPSAPPHHTRERRAIASAGVSSPRLERMRAALRRHLESGQLPGLVAAFSRRGVDQVEAMGTLAFGNDAPMRRDSIFRLASMTKPITAVAAMILAEECRLRLDDPVDGWLPELKDRKVLRTVNSPLDDTVPAARSITLRDLLTFRAGYGEVAFLSWSCPMQQALAEARLPLCEWLFAGSSDELMQRLGRLPLVHQPGERWLYHMPAEILGVLIARVSGMSLGQFLQERIFNPLGMKDTSFRVPEDKLDRLTTCYFTDPTSGAVAVLDEARGGLVATPRPFESGAGGLVSTVDDMLTMGRMLLNKGTDGRERILSRPTVELMTMDHLTPEQKAGSPFFPNFWGAHGWGLGLAVVTRRSGAGAGPGAFGWDGAFGTSWFVDPQEDLVGVLMTQRRPEMLMLPPVILDFWTSVYQAIDD